MKRRQRIAQSRRGRPLGTKGAAVAGLIGTVLLAGSLGAVGATVAIGSRAAIAGTDYIDWGTLGPEFTPIPNPGSVTSTGGRLVDLLKPIPQGGFEVAEEGGLSWLGNFAIGDRLLWMAGEAGPLMLDLPDGSPVGAAGAQIQMDLYDIFHATIEAYDVGGGLLGSHMFLGSSTSAQDNSAIFVGIASDALNIDKLVFRVEAATGMPESFAINRVELGPEVAGGIIIPEASTCWGGAVIGLMSAWGVWRRKRLPKSR